MEEANKLTKKKKITLIVGIVLFLILILSASYAYFQITSVNNATTTTITGNGEALGTPTLTTNTTSLGLTLTTDNFSMSKNIRRRLYATPSGEPIIVTASFNNDRNDVSLSNGRYKLATASVAGGDISYNCTYNFEVSATVTNPITDGSDEDVQVIIMSPRGEIYRYSLKQLLEGTKTVSGVISNLSVGENQEFTLESYAYNNGVHEQQDLSGNSYTISVTPKSGTSGFSCTALTTSINTGFAKALIDSNKMIETGLEGDGYRFVGTGAGTYCIYDNYYYETTGSTCPDRYYAVRVTKSTGERYDLGYRTTCPTGNATYDIECTKYEGTVGNSIPNNYVCFGTTNKNDCTNNPDKYMYRIVGVFPDEYGNQHVKLIKDSSIGKYQWHNSQNLTFWKDSNLYKGLNGSYFYTNTNYDYMQNSTWRGKIADWRYSATMANIWTHGNGIDMNSEGMFSYGLDKDISKIYLHEMNRQDNTITTGFWDYTSSKIGLMYVSDILLSVPIDINNKLTQNDKSVYYANSWLIWQPKSDFNLEMVDYCDTGYIIADEDYGYWTMTTHSRQINSNNEVAYVFISSNYTCGDINNTSELNVTRRTKPVFYLNSNVELNSGTGTNTDPYILK